MRLINLLPWRRNLAQQRLRFWGAVVSGSLMAMLVVHGYRIALGSLDSRRQMLLAESGRQHREWLAQALEQADIRQRLREAQQQENQRRHARRAQILAWRDAILALSGLLPDDVWLTRLEGDASRWRISGLARTSDALSALEQAIGQHSDFRHARAGALAHKGPREWQFTWQFGLGHDAAAP
jgi:pilus assembly protein HofN